jgi:hypothetical protein
MKEKRRYGMMVSLEEGLFRLCSESIATDTEFKKVAINRNFDRVDSALFRKYRLYRLKKTLRYVYEKSLFYRRLFDGARVNINTIVNESIESVSVKLCLNKDGKALTSSKKLIRELE